MWAFLKEWGALIVAFIALVQPWIALGWRRFFRQGSVEIYPTGLLEIGFSSYGPTLGLRGSAHAMHQNMLIRSAEITLTRRRDQAEHILQWGVFRSPTLDPQPQTMQLCSTLSLTRELSIPYNILFWDEGTRERMRPLIEKVSERWTAETVRAGPLIGPALSEAYERFSHSDVHVRTFGELERICYWEPGEYVIALDVNTARPRKRFRKSWIFTLTEREVDYLRQNTVRILLNTCGQQITPWHFAYVKYVKAW